MEVKILKAKAAHIKYIADHVRDADRQEMLDYNMMTPMESIQLSLYNSQGEAWTGLVDGVPVTMFGVAKPNWIWLVGTKDIHKYETVFLIKSRKILKKILEKHPMLENYVEAKNTRSVQWLSWLGFEMDEPERTGANNELFIYFWITGESK